MVPYWPDIAKNHSGDSQGENDFAQAFDTVEKTVVFSRTLEKVERPNAKIVRADPQAEMEQSYHPGVWPCLHVVS
jgi:hypothetical protein